MTQPITTITAEAELTRSESVLAQQMFQQAFPELVRKLPPEGLEQAATKTAAALVAGIKALRAVRHDPTRDISRRVDLLVSSAMEAVRLGEALGMGSTENSSGHLDLAVAGRADEAAGAPDELERRLVLADIEARLTEEVRGLVHTLGEFGSRAKLISEATPDDAYFAKSVTQFFALLGFQVANALAQSMDRRVFFDDGSQYLHDLGLSLNEFVRQVDLDGRRFLAVALIDEQASELSRAVEAGDKR